MGFSGPVRSSAVATSTRIIWVHCRCVPESRGAVSILGAESAAWTTTGRGERDGALHWSATTDARNSATSNGLNVLVAQGNVIFGDDVVYAFDAATGARRWVFDTSALGIGGYGPGRV